MLETKRNFIRLQIFRARNTRASQLVQVLSKTVRGSELLKTLGARAGMLSNAFLWPNVERRQKVTARLASTQGERSSVQRVSEVWKFSDAAVLVILRTKL